MNVIFLLIVVFVLSMLLMPGGLKIKDKTALVLDLDGRIVEQRAGGARDRVLAQASGGNDGQVQLRDVVTALNKAATDPKIDRVVLILDEFQGARLPQLREVAQALNKFKESKKQVVAWGSSYEQAAYYIAAHADEIYLHPMGGVMMQGYGRYRNYYKEALDRLGISANVVRSGKYKNAAEVYFATGPSKETLESEKYLYDAMWAVYTSDVEKARKFEAGTLNRYIDETTARLKAAGGNFGRMALDGKLVTALKTRDEFRAMMIERGAQDTEQKSFAQVSLASYLGTIKPVSTGDAIGVIVAEGEISDGIAPPGRIGGRSTAELVRKAREDKNIKAVVLRVDSPGGSAFGSELIRRELELTQKAGKPVVVSMGGLAASGGYWISMAADEVIADPATITGSIGVFGMLPTGEKAMEKLSLYTGGYSTTWLGGAMYDARRALDPRFGELVRVAIDHTYTDFTTRVATARKSTPEKIDEIAQGRVWTGAQAKDRGLVDRVGSFGDAIKAAQTRAKVDEKTRVAYIEADRSKFEVFFEQFSSKANAFVAAHFNLRLLPAGAPAAAVAEAERDLTWLSEIAARGANGLPMAVVAHCLCDPR
jgi:protease-4